MKKTVLVLMAAVSLLMTACNSENADTDNGSDSSQTLSPGIGAEIVSGPDGNGVLPQYAEISDAAASAALAAVSEVFTKDSSESIADGVSLRVLEFDGGKAYIVTADLSKCSLKASTPYDIVPDTTNQSLRGQAKVLNNKGENVLAGISANFTNRATHIPSGIIIKNGVTIYNNSPGDDGSVYFGLYNDGKAFACNYAEYCEIYRNNVSEAVSATHIIAKDGALCDIAGDIGNTVCDRTGAGFSADRNTVCFVYAEGVTVYDLANLLIGNGCSVAVSFNYGEELSILCKDTVYGTEASVGPSVMITEKKQ